MVLLTFTLGIFIYESILQIFLNIFHAYLIRIKYLFYNSIKLIITFIKTCFFYFDMFLFYKECS